MRGLGGWAGKPRTWQVIEDLLAWYEREGEDKEYVFPYMLLLYYHTESEDLRASVGVSVSVPCSCIIYMGFGGIGPGKA